MYQSASRERDDPNRVIEKSVINRVCTMVRQGLGKSKRAEEIPAVCSLEEGCHWPADFQDHGGPREELADQLPSTSTGLSLICCLSEAAVN